MKKGQQSIALVLLGVVAIIAIIGLILLMKKTPSGYQVYNYDKPYVLESGPLNWENLFAFASSFEDAEGWCPNHRISEGGFLDILQRSGNKQYRCYVIPPDKVPPQYRPFYQEIYSIKPRIAPVACFLGSGMTRPEGYSYPLWCDSGIYSVINYPYYTYPVYPQGSQISIND